MSARKLMAMALLMGLAAEGVATPRRRTDDLSRVPLNRLQLGPSGIERKPTAKPRFTRGPGQKGRRK